MVAGGLFHPDVNPSMRANEMLEFSLKVIDSIEQFDTKICSNLQLRIGINTGGSVCADILGTEKPIFELVGGPIYNAAILQTYVVPGLVYTSNETYRDTVSGSDHIAIRKELPQTNKQNWLTYLVHPPEKEIKN
jgi:class 3 adenylate cyclase